MRLYEIFFRPSSPIRAMSDQERHNILEFIYEWLTGRYMHFLSNEPALPDALQMWEQIARLFPPKMPPEVKLFRMVTVPISLARHRQFQFKPAPGVVSSWTRTLTGLDAVAGVASEAIDFDSEQKTARLGIEAIIPGELILATPRTIRDAFMTLSHDYFDRYKEIRIEYEKDGQKHVRYGYPGWPGDANSDFDMPEVEFMYDKLNRPGGNYRQYEYIVRTPPMVDATVVQIWRMGNRTVRYGNESPHDGPAPSIRRLKR